MAYQTGTPSSTQNLIDIWIAWIVAQGGFSLGNTWTFTAGTTDPDSGTSGTTYTARALIRDGQTVLLCWKSSAPDRLYLNSSTNNPTSGKINAQTNCAAASTYVELGTSPIRYHMFSDGNGTHCALEWLGGVYQHINIGYLEKYGSWTGGVYVTGTLWNRTNVNGSNYWGWDTAAFHNRPFDAMAVTTVGRSGHVRASYSANAMAQFGYLAGTGGVAVGLQLLSSYMVDRSPNTYNGRAVLVPIEVLVGLTDSLTPSHWIPLGRVNNCAYINITNLNPGDTLLTDWMIFPLSAKNSGGTVASGYINSENYGIAYRK